MRTVRKIITSIFRKFFVSPLIIQKRNELLDRQIQILLGIKYVEFAHTGVSLPRFSDVEFSSYSQNGEDGILLFLFSVIGTTNKRVVEICAGDGIECNSANLILNHGWNGLLFDGDLRAIERGRQYYAQWTNASRLRRIPPRLVHMWVTRDNVNDLILQNDMTGVIDLLSIDMDGVDYWVWESIACILPRVVVLEYNNRWGPLQSVTVPYSDNFIATKVGPDDDGYFGASLAAFNKLAKKKGYRLIGANGPNTNAFFMHNTVGQNYFPEFSVDSCLSSDFAIYQGQTKYPFIVDKPVVEI